MVNEYKININQSLIWLFNALYGTIEFVLFMGISAKHILLHTHVILGLIIT